MITSVEEDAKGHSPGCSQQRGMRREGNLPPLPKSIFDASCNTCHIYPPFLLSLIAFSCSCFLQLTLPTSTPTLSAISTRPTNTELMKCLHFLNIAAHNYELFRNLATSANPA